MLNELFGEKNSAKIIDALLNYKEADFSIIDLSRESMINRQSVKKTVDNLHALGIIKVKRRIGKTLIFEIDTEHEIFGNLVKLRDSITPAPKQEQTKIDAGDLVKCVLAETTENLNDNLEIKEEQQVE